MKKAFTLVELLVVVAIISLLLALGLPVMRRVREQGGETVCRSHLRQMNVILKTYTNSHDGVFPSPRYIYHSAESFSDEELWRIYLPCCRWHDARIGLDSPLLRTERPELRGSLWPYLGDTRVVRCKVGRRANEFRGCSNACPDCVHDPGIDIVPQYTYTMNDYLNRILMTGISETGEATGRIDSRTIRQWEIFRETQVTRSPSMVFTFGEENSWAINTEGRQPIGPRPEWAAEYNLSGKYYLGAPPHLRGFHGTILLPNLSITPTYRITGGALYRYDRVLGDAFATCHRPRKGDLNAGHSYVAMLDGHVRRVTVADQLRRSRQIPRFGESRLAPGGNLALAWPLDIPPPGGWDNQ